MGITLSGHRTNVDSLRLQIFSLVHSAFTTLEPHNHLPSIIIEDCDVYVLLRTQRVFSF